MSESSPQKRKRSELQANDELRILLLSIHPGNDIDDEFVNNLVEIIQKNPSTAGTLIEYEPERFLLPLYIAIDRGAPIEVVNALFKAHSEAMYTVYEGDTTLLHLACTTGNFQRSLLEVVSLLIDEFPEALWIQNSLLMTPLHVACMEERSSLEVVSLLVEKYPTAMGIKDKYGRLPLHWACRQGFQRLGLVSLLVEKHPAAVREKDLKGKTPLHHSCSKGVGTLEVFNFLLEKCPSLLEEKDNKGKTLLHEVCSGSLHYGLISLLIKQNPVFLKQKDVNGRIPLHCVCKNPSATFGLLALLLERYPAAVEAVDSKGKTPLDRFKNCYGASDCERIEMILTGVDSLLKNDTDKSSASKIMKDFIDIEWWGGVRLVFELCPPAVQHLEDMETNIVPSLLSMMGRHSKLLTVRNMISSRQDILKID